MSSPTRHTSSRHYKKLIRLVNTKHALIVVFYQERLPDGDLGPSVSSLHFPHCTDVIVGSVCCTHHVYRALVFQLQVQHITAPQPANIPSSCSFLPSGVFQLGGKCVTILARCSATESFPLKKMFKEGAGRVEVVKVDDLGLTQIYLTQAGCNVITHSL